MSSTPLELREVTASDRKCIFDWANDTEARRFSFSSEPIAWQAHCLWFEQRLNDPRSLYYIALIDQGLTRPAPTQTIPDGPIAIGQARFDAKRSSGGEAGTNEDISGACPQAVISVSIAAPWRGKGYGTTLIELATARAYEARRFEVIYAYIRPENRASCRAFSRAGYAAPTSLNYRGQAAVQLTWRAE